ncbi:uncharacterized protein N7479_009274 [Penicillium vulpinum]|uniref:uncharacterized protein n=1 Tax=Penicillium vulpinum TaxID=29845 RepID=UPI00254749B6|nr:uncharacterized protein N7479_009274 [Penicillium vulpinum]KAJ5950861.1 hypothetical protein N7479_009274 [Penicillium vulpinum]
MSSRAFHGTYEEERRHFLTTLHAQIHILRDNHNDGVEMAIDSLNLLLRRVNGLRIAGQAHFKHDNTSWTSRCNKIYHRVEYFIDALRSDRSSSCRVANDIERFRQIEATEVVPRRLSLGVD